MENFERQEEIVKYLDRYYFVKEGIFFNKQHEQEWGVNLLEYLVKIFCHDVDFTHDTLKDWYYSKGFDKITDLQRYSVMDAEAELIKMISDEIAKEIDAQILKDLKGQIKHKEDFFEVLECIGITTTPTFYNPMTFSPQKGFITSTYEQRENARKNNVIWNYWVRTRGLHT